MESSIVHYQPPENKIVQQWIEEYHADNTDGTTILPDFKGIKTTIKWGEKENNIESTAFEIL
eukprot:4808697-Ditylum_brightwellii.AAC.1